MTAAKSDTQELDTKTPHVPSKLAAAPTIEMMMQSALDAGRTPDELKELFALYERMQDRQAEQAFNVALAKFQSECPPVKRRSENAQFMVSVNGQQRPRRYASLDDIAAAIRGPLANNGLSYTWGDSEEKDGKLRTPCLLSHVAGHTRSVSVAFPTESKAGASAQQKCGAVMSYAQRYSLIAALGLTSCDDDVDGADASDPVDPITEEQAIQISELIESKGSDPARFKDYYGIKKFGELPGNKFDEAVALLQRKK